MKKAILFILTMFLSTAIFAQTYNTIDIDGVAPGSKVNDWNSDEDFTDCSSADNSYFTWDADYIYVGIKDDDADLGNSATFIYFDTDPEGTNGYIGGYAWDDDITLPFKGDYVIVIKNESGDDYIEIRTLSGGGYTQVASETALTLDAAPYYVQAAIGTDYREFRIKRTTIGSPSAIKVCMFTEQRFGSNWRYFAWPSEGWTDASRAAGQTIDHYKGYTLSEGYSPDAANAHDDVLLKNLKVVSLDGGESFYIRDDGNGDGTNDLDVSSAWTFEAWINVGSYSSGSYDCIMDRQTVFSFYLVDDDDDDYAVTFAARNSSDAIIASIDCDGTGSTSGNMVFGTWYHVAATYDGTTAKLYINGTEVDSDTDVDWPLTSSSNTLNIGGRYWVTYERQMSNTDIDEIRISDIARPIADMQTTIGDNAYTSDANTVLLMHLDDSVTPPTFLSGTGYNGTTGDDPDFTPFDYIDFGTLPLPVELTSFTASSTGSATVLNWETATEVNNYGFEVQRMLSEAEAWTTIGFVPGHGNSNTAQSYSFVATDGAKFYRLKQMDTDGSSEYSNVVEVKGNLSYKLSQNHPNPFNPTTKINFSIPEAAKVSITVFNALGQKVAELANREFAVGNHSVDFNASNLTSGIYFYRLNSANFSKTMKMMLLK